jgi:hypothetical protein
MPKNGKEVPCPTCGTQNYWSQSRLKKKNNHFCGQSCYSEWQKSKPSNTGRTRFKKGIIPWNKGIEWHEMRGEKSPNWKGGKTIMKNGYVWLSQQKMYQHHYVWIRDSEWHFIPQRFDIHHKNLNKQDNRIENLVCIPKHIHTKLHHAIRQGEIGGN